MNNYAPLCDEFVYKNGNTVNSPIFKYFNFLVIIKLETCNFVVYIITFCFCYSNNINQLCTNKDY